MPLAPLNIPTRSIGNSTHLDHHSELWIMGFGGVAHCVAGQLQGRRNFAGFWEYLLSDGLMVTPMHPEFGGAALLDPNGKLVGVGALALHDPNGNARHNSTLFVPADSIPALVERVMRTGKANLRSQPWLGVYATDHQGEVVIMDVAANGPAAQAKLRQGDQITMVNTEPVQDLIHFYRLLWQHEAGSVIELGIKRKTRQRKLPVLSTSRDAFFHKPVRH